MVGRRNLEQASYRHGPPRVPMVALCALLAGCAISSPGSSTYVGRRLPYSSEGRDRVYTFFYGTNRVTSEEADGIVTYGSEPGTVTKTGQFRVRIQQGFKATGSNPSRWKGVELEAVEESRDEVFFESLKHAVDASPSRSLLVVVFGFRESLETSAVKTAVFSYRIDINTPVLMFDWPGNQSVTVGGYRRAFGYARRSGADLGYLLRRIVRDVRPENLWVTGNSMGAQVICDAFSYMVKQPDFSDAAPEIRHVLLAAPDVGKGEFDSRFLEELNALSERLTVYVSSGDTALLLSHWILATPRLGRDRVSPPEQLEELEELLALKAEGAERITVIDFTPVNRASHGHNYYIESSEYFDDFYDRLQGTPPVTGRRLHPAAYQGGVAYWVLWDDEE